MIRRLRNWYTETTLQEAAQQILPKLGGAILIVGLVLFMVLMVREIADPSPSSECATIEENLLAAFVVRDEIISERAAEKLGRPEMAGKKWDVVADETYDLYEEVCLDRGWEPRLD